MALTAEDDRIVIKETLNLLRAPSINEPSVRIMTEKIDECISDLMRLFLQSRF